jgi:hexosaminidase
MPIKPHIRTVLLFCILAGTASIAQAQFPAAPLIPKPQFVELTDDAAANFIRIGQNSALELDPLHETACGRVATLLSSQLATGIDSAASITLLIDTSVKHPDGYMLRYGREGVVITGGSESGLYYGAITLLQLLKQNGGSILYPFTIIDKPRFAWRGMHLDVSRHFFSVEEIKRYLDLLAMYKMNVFHWHLTDDQGWRIEIEKYPLLTQVGGYRDETLIGRPSEKMKFDGQRHGGFYTQAQVREIVAYAAERHISVVPEIEMPGHSRAALAAYPQYACTDGPFKTATSWGVFEDVYCAGKDETFNFLTDVLDEVMALFPSQFVHIGGDECPKTRWKACAACQKRLQTDGLKDEHELQSYFIKRIEKHVNSRGKTIIGWDEILEGGLAPNAAVMSWRGTEGGIAAAKAGHYVVMSPGKPCYFDHYQVQETQNEPLAIGGFNPLEAVYAYEPIPAGITPEQAGYILGAQGNVWTEYMPTFDQVTYMALPRMAALAEVLWTNPANKDFQDFKKRLAVHNAYLDARGYNYHGKAVRKNTKKSTKK